MVKGKRGLSVVIGYVLLVTFGIALSILVYNYLKTYVPTQAVSCPSGTSIFLKDYNYSCSGSINLTLENNGRFGMQGYFVYGSTTSGGLPTFSLASYFIHSKSTDGYSSSQQNIVYFHSVTNSFNESLGPNEETNQFFGGLGKKIYSIEILPVRIQAEGSTNKVVSCSNAKIIETVSCS